MPFDQDEGSREADGSSECSTSTPTEGTVMHKVAKTDNLAGLAVKYGVTVFDIKAVNGLHSDHAMYGRDTLIIPQKKGDKSKSVDRDTMVRFVGGLGCRSIEPGIGSTRSKSDAKDMLRNLQPTGSFLAREMPPVQEIELHEHVGYAGSQSGVEQTMFADRVRRRKREDEADEGSRFGRVIAWGSRNIVGSVGRPPVRPIRTSDPLSASVPKDQHSSMIGVIKNIIPGYMIEKVKTIANSSALDSFGTPIQDRFIWPDSRSSVGPRSLSETAGTQQRAMTPKNCPKTE